MGLARTWQAYPASYRAKEMAILVRCMLAGESGSAIGLAGAGKSNLLGFFCHRPDALRALLPQDTPYIVPVLVDFNNLPSNDLAMLFRVVLRALYEAGEQLAVVDESLAQTAELYYRRVEEKTDPFLSQSALREVLYAFRDRNARLVLVLDPFGPFCRSATPQVLDNMRGLRDSFKDTLSYVVGLRKELAVLRDPTDMGELYEVLDTHKCYIGAMTPEDARWVIEQVKQTTGYTFRETQVARLAELSGAYPSLLRATSTWLTDLPSPPPETDWAVHLLAEPSVRHRLEELWAGLEEDEQRALIAVQCLPSESQASHDRSLAALKQQYGEALVRLSMLGICEARGKRWHVCSELLARYASDAARQTVDEISVNEETGELYFGQVPLTNLTPLEYEALLFLVRHPHVRHTKIDLILNAWPNDPCPLERTDDSIYQVIRGLRRKIEPNPSKPRYIVTWRGTQPREGGYQFFPQGK